MNTVRKPLTTLALALALTAPALAAQSHADHDHSTPDGMAQHMQMMQMPAASGAATQQAQANGEVRKIDPASGKITLRHGPIPSLGMGAMTMNYRLADPKLIDGLKVGDKVRFTVQQQDGTDVVTRIDRVQ
ncbi:copper-binding protein [Thiomonas bhubaneswarensis]|uniref:Periplasmic Cu and Ag efflux protein CusF n=1 Tax=Thiomonas bhubaneswarensis TaxID=339866 RepID=A0A0K6HUR6_9BURK|nr:copper-binding protein [Thiomonas bhubaneswarensis]CUA94644.1 Periplasmic Cu and Ag efflux protein CusF [Thiomonas bhubaneswarensis]